jgi:hypothetical protein
MIVSQKVLVPAVVNALIGLAVVVIGEVAKDPELRFLGIGLLGGSGLGGGLGYRARHTSSSTQRALKTDPPE